MKIFFDKKMKNLEHFSHVIKFFSQVPNLVSQVGIWNSLREKWEGSEDNCCLDWTGQYLGEFIPYKM
jgi:hypothetical protein